MSKTRGRALVTGASRGLGRSFARRLAKLGYELVVTGRDDERLAGLARELEGTGAIVSHFAVDLGSEGGVERLTAFMDDNKLEISLLVNNAGHGEQGRFHTLERASQISDIFLQTVAIADLTHRLIGPMIERGTGAIINISSLGGFQPMPFAAAYSGAKAFLTNFSLALEAEVSRFGVTVVTVCPGRLAASSEGLGNVGERKKYPGGELTHETVINDALRALDAKSGLVIPGKANKFAAFAAKLVPRRHIARLVKKFSSQ